MENVFKIIYFDGYDEVRDYDTHKVIFSTVNINPDVIDEVVCIWNKTKCLKELDDYLLDEEKCTSDERELIIESIYNYPKILEAENISKLKQKIVLLRDKMELFDLFYQDDEVGLVLKEVEKLIGNL